VRGAPIATVFKEAKLAFQDIQEVAVVFGHIPSSITRLRQSEGLRRDRRHRLV
jgi:hypothetical protein